ncbi:MAG: cadherin-like beta sandwich domain-containing protein [Clostridia bacterium]|nr:cadherin-like beta sandwich domain-containing protein [Clostridia bacterium]
MKIIKKIILLSIIILCIIAAFSKVNAASASISSNKTTMNIGDTAKISIKYTAAAWNVQVSGAVSYSNADASSNAKNTSKSTSINFKPKKAGTYTISLSGDVTDENGKTTDLSKSLTIKVKEKTNNTSSNNSNSNNNTTNNNSDSSSKPSTDATLKNLGIKPNDFSGFRKANTSYSISVPKNVEKISIYATPTNSKALVTGTGSKTLQIGNNTFNIKVTAEDKKTTKTYTLTINRKDKEDTKSDATLANLGIRPKEYDFTGFKSNVTTYNVTVSNDVEKITIYANAKNVKDTIVGSGNKSLKVGQNKCEIKVISEDKKTSKTYVINVTRKEKEEEPEEKPKEDADEDKDNNQKVFDGLKNIEIKEGNLSPNFSQDVYSYEVTAPSGTEKLDINTQTTSDDIEVEIAGNENLKQGENIITILVNNQKEDTTLTYQINVKVGNQEIDLSVVNDEFKDAENKTKIQGWIIKGTIIAVIALIIIFLIERYKISQEYEEDEDEYEEEEIEDEEEDDDDDMRLIQPYNTNTQYKSTASEEIRNIGLFDESQEFVEYRQHRKNKRYKGRRFK